MCISLFRIFVAAVLSVASCVGVVSVSATSAQALPANGRIAYVGEDDNLWTMNPDGSDQRKIVDVPVSASPVWSLDSSRIAYIRYDGEWYNPTIWVVNADGTGNHHVADGCCSAEWSPDGTQIAYETADYPYDIRRVNADGSGDVLLASGASEPEWSGTKIAYESESDGDIWVMNADGTNKTHFVGHAGTPQWSPNGAKIAYETSGDYGELWVRNVDGSSPIQLDSINYESGYDQRWSPDSSKLTFDRGTDNGFSIWRINADGSGLRKLSGGDQGSYSVTTAGAAWSPDGAKIAYRFFDDEDSTPADDDGVYVMNADGSGQRKLAPGTDPSWGTAPVTVVPLCRGLKATMVGTDGADTLRGTSGPDVIYGLGGSDVIEAGGGNDIVCGGDGNDVIKGGAGHDRLHGNRGNDRVNGNAGGDRVYGDSGGDTLGGDDGDDTVVGGTGADRLYGGAGYDTVRYDSTHTAGVRVSLDGVANDGNGTDGGSTSRDNVSSNVEFLVGTKGADILSGSGGRNRIYGLGGNDRLTGKGGADRLYGQGGDDSLNAKDGIRDERIDGGNGRDTVSRDSVDPAPLNIP